MIPVLGETYEGHYIYHDIIDIQMESDFVAFDYVDLLTLKDVQVSKEHPTTYINMDGPKKTWSISGNLTYESKWKGNNLIIALPGALTIKFFDAEGND